MEKIASKNRIIYQELKAVSGTFAIPVTGGKTIDKSRLVTQNTSLRSAQAVRRNRSSIGVLKPVK